MNVVSRPSYRLSSDFMWLRKFRNNNKVLKNLRSRAIRAFELSITEQYWYDYRAVALAVEAMERFWAAQYPDIVDVPEIEIYDISRRGSFRMSINNNLYIFRNLQDAFDIPARCLKVGGRFHAEDLIKLRTE